MKVSNMSEAAQNRREYLRFPTDALVWWNKDWEPEPISLLDISAGGMLCEYPNPLENGSNVSLHFEFPGFGQLILCNCEVVHCSPEEGTTFYKIGLRIKELEGMELEQFIDRLKNGPPSKL